MGRLRLPPTHSIACLTASCRRRERRRASRCPRRRPCTPPRHAGIFVRRVRGLTPGLYLLERNATDHDRLRAALRADFLWRRPAGCPEHLRLFVLAEVDLREAARVTSCHQEIASDGA